VIWPEVGGKDTRRARFKDQSDTVRAEDLRFEQTYKVVPKAEGLAMRALTRKLKRLEALARVQQRADSPTLALLRQDPARLMTAAGMEPDGWQRTLLACNAARMLLLCCRQAGKSTAAAALALRVALLQPRSPVLLLSPSLRQSGELFRKVLDLFGALGRPMGVTAESALRLELANGSRVVSLPADEATIRGFSGVALLVIDEAARVPDELYRAVRPMLAVSNGQLVCLSTPYGQRGFFYAEWHSDGPWERIRITAEDCPRISKAFLAEEQRALGESWFAQEYLCSFTQMEGLVYPEFGACVIDACAVQGVRAWAGCDFGWHNPSAFVVCVADADDIVYVVDEVYGPRMTDEGSNGFFVTAPTRSRLPSCVGAISPPVRPTRP
jgi:Terminase large subunit, T4likevirus-type, N-terminal